MKSYSKLKNKELNQVIADLRNSFKGREAKRALAHYCKRKNLRDTDYLNIVIYYFLFNDFQNVIKYSRRYNNWSIQQKTDPWSMAILMFQAFTFLSFGCHYWPRAVYQLFKKNNLLNETLKTCEDTFPGCYSIFLRKIDWNLVVEFCQKINIVPSERYGYTYASMLFNYCIALIKTQQLTKAQEILDLFGRTKFHSIEEKRARHLFYVTAYCYYITTKDDEKIKIYKELIDEKSLQYRDQIWISTFQILQMTDSKKIFDLIKKQLLRLDPIRDYDFLLFFLDQKEKRDALDFEEEIFLRFSSVSSWRPLDKKNIFGIKREKLASYKEDQYLEEIDLLRKNKRPFLDLFYGAYYDPKSNKMVLLSLILVRALRVLIGASRYGIHFFAFSDYIWREKNYLPKTLPQNVNRILIELKKIGIQIEHKNSVLKIKNFGDWPFESIFFAADENGAHLSFIKLKYKIFDARDLCHEFPISIQSACRWIADWEKENLVSFSKISSKRKFYRICSP